MNHKNFIYATIATAMLFSACKKDIADLDNTYPGNISSNGALANFIAQNAPQMQQFTVSATSGGVLNGSGGAIVTIQPNAFLYTNNQPVAGVVTITLQEVYSKRDVIFSGANTTSSGLPLSSGGEVYFVATQGSQQLILAGPNFVTLSIPAYNNAPPMQEFTTANFSGSNDFSLITGPTGSVIVIPDSLPIAITNSRYQLQFNSLGWTNCDQFLNTALPTTEFSVPVPSIFNEGNSIMIVSKADAVCASQVHYFDAPTNAYTCGYYRLPVGEEFTFSIMSEINGHFYWDSRTVTITEDISVTLNPQLCTEAQMYQNVSSL